MGIEYKCDSCAEYFRKRVDVAEFKATFSSAIYDMTKTYEALLCRSCVMKMRRSIEEGLKGETP